ncbi:hypothetical protein BJV78DRAFT_1185631 [Lactifluus subvellereus]|nr:hypothetical protein BJV78DRAFT_1185631 [Lactifluus subvellereus]
MFVEVKETISSVHPGSIPFSWLSEFMPDLFNCQWHSPFCSYRGTAKSGSDFSAGA